MCRKIFSTSARRRRHPPSSDLKVPIRGPRTATGSQLFSCLAYLYTTTCVFHQKTGLVGKSGKDWHAKCWLPVSVGGSKTSLDNKLSRLLTSFTHHSIYHIYHVEWQSHGRARIASRNRREMVGETRSYFLILDYALAVFTSSFFTTSTDFPGRQSGSLELKRQNNFSVQGFFRWYWNLLWISEKEIVTHIHSAFDRNFHASIKEFILFRV